MSRESVEAGAIPGGVDRSELAELYSRPPEEFTRARNELAKRLRESGETEAANAVRTFKRPTAAAGIVNRLVRTEPERVSELLEAGEALRAAQDEVLQGSGSGDEVRVAGQRANQAVASLVEAARNPPGDERPPSGQTIQRLTETLEAVHSDPETRALVEEGRLDRERRGAALGLAEPVGGRKKKGAKRTRGAAKDGLRRELERARGEEETIRDELETAEGSVARKSASLEEAQERVKVAKQQLKRAEEAARDAARRLRAAERKSRGIAGKLGR